MQNKAHTNDTLLNPQHESELVSEAKKFRTSANKAFARYLRKVRSRAGVTQLDLSLSLGRGPKYIWRLENCYSEPDIYEFIEIMEAVGADPALAIGVISGGIK